MQFVANPVIVSAWEIHGIKLLDNGGAELTLYGEKPVTVSSAMLARFTEDGKELVPGDYFVIQSDNYAYLNPKHVFERKYKPVKYWGLSFGEAIDAIKAGHRVTRPGWNGKGMWLCLGKGNPALAAVQFWNPHTREFAEENGGKAPVLPYIIMKNAVGEVVMGWTPTGQDALAEDWVLITDE